MSETIQCVHCGKPIKANPRVKNQRYCRDKECQRARRRKWQREKLLSDPDYKANQRDCQRKWREHHPGYYRAYRQRHPQSRERNRLLQRYRNSRRRTRQKIAKMDTFQPAAVLTPSLYYLLPVIAQMDTPAQKVLIIPAA